MELLIIDDHPVFRAGLRQILLDQCEDLVITEAGSGREALQRLEAQEPDAVVLDISLPDMSGIEVLRRIRRSRPQLAIVVLTLFDEVQFSESAAKMGASGFLSKALEPEELARAILRIALGERAL